MSGWKKITMDMDRISPDYIVRDAVGDIRKKTQKPAPRARVRRRYGVGWLDAWLEKDEARR